MTTESEPVVDVETLTQLQKATGDDPRIMRKVIDVYLGDAPRQIELIRTGVSDGNMERVNRGAHTLKSTSGTMGAHRLAQMSRELEAMTAPGLEDTIDFADSQMATRIAALVAELERVIEALDAFVPADDS